MANVKFEYSGKLSDGRFFDEDSKKKVIVDLEDSDLTVDEMLEEFMNFMQAIGYKFEIGDRFAVVNDFKEFEKKDELKIDFSKYDQDKPKISDAELAAEVARIRSMTMGLSEEALEMAAWNNLANKGV
jgi:hypothetical protein